MSILIFGFSDPNESTLHAASADENEAQNTTRDDSFVSELPKTKKKPKKSSEKSDDAKKSLEMDKKSKKFVPVRGQITAYKKLEKIKG